MDGVGQFIGSMEQETTADVAGWLCREWRRGQRGLRPGGKQLSVNPPPCAGRYLAQCPPERGWPSWYSSDFFFPCDI